VNLSISHITNTADDGSKQCSRKKLFCDGLSPCGSCSGGEKRHSCSNSLSHGNGARVTDPTTNIPATASASEELPQQVTANYPPSVAFLLSEDYQHIFSKFNFPEPTSPDDSGNGRTTGWRDAYSSSAQTPFRGLDEDFLNSVLDFDFFPLASRGPSTRCASVEPQDANSFDETTKFPCTEADTERLVKSVMKAPTLQLLTDRGRLEAQQQLQDLCSPACVARFVAHYFNIWHLNCRIVHRPSFNFDTCDSSLVLAVIFLGAMYSADPTERLTASAVIDHVESYIFSCLPLSRSPDESCHEGSNAVTGDEQDFQIIQAAFTMVITQFWTGTGAQKLRASTRLFDIVVEVRTIRVSFEIREHLITPHCTECALTRLDDVLAIT
jgi:hypothetical protein